MTSILVIDTETTGMDETTDKVVEIAGVRIENGEVVYVRHCLVDPERAIPVQASAVHHLTDKDVVGARKLNEALSYIGVRDEDVIVAHNAEFDKKFLPVLSTQSWVCTWKGANKFYPDAPAFGNQVLRYYLDIEIEEGSGREGQPHSAGYDARTTAQILLKLLEKVTIEDLLNASVEPVLLRKVPFGKHRGMCFSEVPKDYLRWLKGRDNLDRDLAYTLEQHL